MHTKFNTPDRPPEQLELPGIEFVPPKVRSHGLREAHTYPLVSRGKRPWRAFSSFRVAAAEAWAYPEIELRTGNSAPCLVLDLDGATALGKALWVVEKHQAREWNWSVTRKDGGGTHLIWTLDRPVLTGPDMRISPIRLLGRVAEYYAQVFEADPGYTGVLTHNPMAAAHGRGFFTNWGRHEAYRLDELAAVIPFGWRIPKVALTAAGRNCALFDALRRFAGSPDNAEHDLFAVAMAINQGFDIPLGVPEVRGIAKSVTKRRARWSAAGAFYTDEQRTLWGRERGIRSGAARRKRTADRDAAIVEAVMAGRSMRDVGREFGLTEGAVRWIVRRGA